MKKKLLIVLVVVIILFPCTMISAAKPLDIPGQTKRNGPKENIYDMLYLHFQELAEKHFLKTGQVPQGLLMILDGYCR